MSTERRCLAEHAEELEGAEGSGRGGGHGRPLDENEIGGYVLTEAIRIHRGLGPGLLESVYEAVLANALRGHGLRVSRQVPIPIEFGGGRLDEGFRVDLVVEGKVIVELKSVEGSRCPQEATLDLPEIRGPEAWLSSELRWSFDEERDP